MTHYKILHQCPALELWRRKSIFKCRRNTPRSDDQEFLLCRVFVGNGYYDLATPFFATEYTFNHLGLDPTLMHHVTMKNYEGGHMMYIYRPSLIKLKEDLAAFYTTP